MLRENLRSVAPSVRATDEMSPDPWTSSYHGQRNQDRNARTSSDNSASVRVGSLPDLPSFRRPFM